MLAKKEKILMNYIFNKCEGKESQLIAPNELLNQLKPRYDISEGEIKEMLDNLVLDGYITMILSDKKGKTIYCISLDKKGESYERDRQHEKQSPERSELLCNNCKSVHRPYKYHIGNGCGLSQGA